MPKICRSSAVHLQVVEAHVAFVLGIEVATAPAFPALNCLFRLLPIPLYLPLPGKTNPPYHVGAGFALPFLCLIVILDR